MARKAFARGWLWPRKGRFVALRRARWGIVCSLGREETGQGLGRGGLALTRGWGGLGSGGGDGSLQQKLVVAWLQ